MNVTGLISKRVLAASVAAMAVFAYANTLGNGFVYDDTQEILENWWIRDFRNIPAMFTSNAWSFHENVKTSNYYRPMMHVFHMGAYYLFGLKPWGHHLLNVILNAVVSSAVFLVFAGLLRGRSDEEPRFSANVIALAGALIFTLHPAHTEVVAWASAMAELEASIFGLLGLYFYMRSEGMTDRRYVASVFLLFFAMLTKETAIVYFPLIAAYDYCMEGRFRPLRRYAAYALALGVYLALRISALKGFTPVNRHPGFTGMEYLMNAFPLIADYLRFMALPVKQSAYHVFYPAVSLADGRVIAGLAASAAYAAALYFSRGVLRFAILLAVLPVLPAIYIPALGANVFAERYLYLSVAGFALVAAVLSGMAYEKRLFGGRTGIILVAAAAAIFAVYSGATVMRNLVWKNNISLWADAVEKYPGSAFPRVQLGLALQSAGRTGEAEQEFLLAARMEPDYLPSHANLGVIYLSSGRLAEAERELLAAARLSPGDIIVRYNLGMVYDMAGRLADAEREYLAAISSNPKYAPPHNALGAVHARQGRIDKALEEFKEAVRLNPDFAGARENLAQAYEIKGMKSEAQMERETLARIKGRAVR